MKDTLPIEHKTNLWLLLQANPAQGCPDSVNLVPVYIPSLLRLVPPLLTVQGAYPPVPVTLHSPTASAKLFHSYPCLLVFLHSPLVPSSLEPQYCFLFSPILMPLRIWEPFWLHQCIEIATSWMSL